MKMAKVSIIIPNYNGQKFLEKCLQSIISQTYKDIEIIIVDDCSNDNSINIIQNFQTKDSRIKLIINTINQGVSKTRNIGIKASETEWITTLDSDDYFLSPFKIEKEMKIIKEHNSHFIVAYSGIIEVDEYENKFMKIMSEENIREGNIFIDILTRDLAIPRDFIFSKELYNIVGGYDHNLALYEDWDFKIRLSQKANFYYSGIDGIAYRRHQNGLSSAKVNEHKKWVMFIFDKYIKDLNKKSELELILKKNYNFGESLDYSIKNYIVNNLINQIKLNNINSFSIFGIGELTNLFITKLTSENMNKNVNFIIDSRSRNINFSYFDKTVIPPEIALERGETKFVLLSWNKTNILENILRSEAKNFESKDLLIVKSTSRKFNE